ncbi:terminase small subunit [Mesorhizobium sp. ANAO-SY3R2]|uniref:terminase small subunit n=1 Tax=Mesorhizobium sp. ANAO-SY3R2 TaxID=3166644 RepID=UPI00367135B2
MSGKCYDSLSNLVPLPPLARYQNAIRRRCNRRCLVACGSPFDLNATQPAIRAKTAGQVGFENLKVPEIAEAIEKARSKTAAKLEISKERIIDDLAKIAFASCSALPRA